MKRKKNCIHVWDLAEKRVDNSGRQIWEFYCKKCTAIKMKRGDGAEWIIW